MNAGLKATLGQVAKNKGGTHGGIDPTGSSTNLNAPAGGSSGNPGTTFPWEGADATSKPGEVPPLTHLGGTASHDLNPGH